MTAEKILVIRRDNIGDLVCTTPLIHALRRQLPNAKIDCLVTSYNKEILSGNIDINTVHSYTKAKHRQASDSLFGIYMHRILNIIKQRKTCFDWVLLPGGMQSSAQRIANWIAPKQILLRDDQDNVAGPHEVQQCCHLLLRLGLAYETPAPRIFPVADEAQLLQKKLWKSVPNRVIGLHISARKPSQRWSVDNFSALARQLADTGTVFLLFWSPGSTDNPLHPGDDEKAAILLAKNTDLAIYPVATHSLSELITGLSLCDFVICGDGGAMHVAAGLGKPIVCFFGQSNAQRWHPWGVPFELLQSDSKDVQEITVNDAVAAFGRLLSKK